MFNIKKIYVLIICSIILVVISLKGFNFIKKNKTNKDILDKDLNSNYDLDNEINSKQNFLADSSDHLIWFVQISDIHISMFHDETRIKDFEHFCKNILALIKPKVVIASGDLTDAKNDNLIGSRQNEQEWKTYHKIIYENDILKNTVWLDVRGNHDNFDVHDRNDDTNFFRKYGVMKDTDRSYLYNLSLPNGDKYSFIGIDACVDPGPRRPFNFFGSLSNKDLDQIEKFSEYSQSSNGTIWFGHFPTSTIYSSINPRTFMKNGVAYLCGHLHTLGGLLPSMYARHSNGLLELELSDWKINRKFRILAFDAGLFSFKDFKFSNNQQNNEIYVLITNPKSLQFKTTNNREPLKRMRYSSHIRFLIFSKYPVQNAKVFIDEMPIGQGRQIDSGPLYVADWNPYFYSTGVHKIKIIIQDSNNQIETASQEFSLDDSIKSFKLLNNFILTIDQISLTKNFFYISIAGLLAVLIFFRFNRRKFTVSFVSCGPIRTFVLRYFRRFALLTSIDYVFWILIVTTVYVAIGPWFVGEILDNYIGVCFIWGMIVKGAYITADVQYVMGTLHMIFFQSMLILHLSYQIENRFMKLTFNDEPNSLIRSQCTSIFKSIINYLFQNLSFIILVISCILNIYDLYLSYSLISILICPIKTWLLFLAIYLRYKCSNLNSNDFNKFIDTSKFISNHSNNQYLPVNKDDDSNELLVNDNYGTIDSNDTKTN